MNADNEKIKRIIVKSVLGTLTEEENVVLEEWFQENDRNRVLYQKLSSTVELKHKYKQYENIDVAGAFRRNQRRLYQNVPNRVLKRILPYAAVVLLLFGGVFCFLMNRSGEVREEVPVALSAGGKYAELILANGQKVDLHEGMEMKLRERSSNIQVKGNVVYYEENKDSVTLGEYNMIRTPLGGEYSLTLADGTKVWLNAMSELRYPVAFGEGVREVELKGEAYFEVEKNEGKPFIVKTDEFNVRVLGTSFNISAYLDSPLAHTTLCSGHVRINDRTNPGKEVDILPGEQLLFHRDNREISVREVDTDVFVSWREGFFQFDNNTVEEVFTILQRWYNIQVFYANVEVRQELFTGKLPRFDNLQIIIDLIERVSDLKIEVRGKMIYIDK
ncbi:FecR family protein [Butyricimonas faecihominis]